MTMRRIDLDPLVGAFAKIERAKIQIDSIGADIRTFFEHTPCGLEAEVEGAIDVWRFKLKHKLPHALNVDVGGVLYNLRSPLDQMLSAVALQNRRTAGGVQFPFGRTKDEFEAAVVKQKKLPPDAIEMLRSLQPYVVGGNVILCALHYLNKADKHRPGLIPVNVRTSADLSQLIVSGGHILTVGPRTGRHLIRDADNNLSQDVQERQPRIEIQAGRGPRLIFEVEDRPQEDMEIATALPGTEFFADFEPTLDVAFREVEGLPSGRPVVEILTEMRRLIEGILLSFRERFFASA